MKSELYSKYAKKYDLAVQNNIYNAHLERPSLQSMLNDLSGLNVLDLGCGSGIYTQYLLEKNAAVTSIDISEEMVNIVNKKFVKKVKAYAQDLSNGLPDEKSNSFDVVISPLMVHYIKDLTKLFNDIHRVLKEKGYFVFSTHHPIVDFESTTTGNYFEPELLIEEWKTIDKPVEVSFYRRSLTDLFNFISASRLVVTQLSEGKPSEEMKKISEEKFEYLSKKPNFLFIKCKKI